jgi:hypothetical protein
MARIKWLNSNLTGKLGDIVGSSWKGIKYVKTYGKPSNPKTEEQTKVRTVFKQVQMFAMALHKAGVTKLFASVPKMTPINQVIKANKQMFQDKVFDASKLNMSMATFEAVVTMDITDFANAGGNLTSTISNLALNPNLTQEMKDNLKLWVIVYDKSTNTIWQFEQTNLPAIITSGTGTITANTGVSGLVTTNLTILCFFTTTSLISSAKNKKAI